MYHTRKMLSVIFLLFIIVVSLLFSNIFKQNLLEGMNTTSVGDIEKPSEGTDTDESGPVVETDSDSSGPVVETDSDSDGTVVETADDETKPDDTISYKENFQTKLVGTPINYKNTPQTTTLDDSLRAKPEINGVFNHIFGFSKQQTFQVKHP